MTNFKVGQKVVLKKPCTDQFRNNYSTDRIFTVNKLYPIGGSDGVSECTICFCDDKLILIDDVEVCSCQVRPISYSTNVNFEVIANFSPKEEKSDVPVKNPEPVKNSNQ